VLAVLGPSAGGDGVPAGRGAPAPPPPPGPYSLGQLLQELRLFGESYHEQAEAVRHLPHALRRQASVELGNFVSRARMHLQGVPGFNELRAATLSLWGQEISFAAGQRIVDALVQGASGGLTAGAAEALTLEEAALRLTSPPAAVTPPTQGGTKGPEAPADVTRGKTTPVTPVGEAREFPSRPAGPEARHSTDYRSVVWFGTSYYFTPTQAACVKVLWREWANGTPEVGEDTVLEDHEVEADAKRLIDVFRDRKSPARYHPAWGSMIVPGSTKGAYRLNPPEKS
jgi:hypothetical protein